MPPSALRKGKFASRALLDLSIIHELFGVNATLYSALSIGQWAEPDDIRRAYLRQGRATLFNCGFIFTKDHSPRNLDDFPEIIRKKFQAVSIAYEVLSQAELRSYYDKHGVVYVIESPASTRRNIKSVRWESFVEEKRIIDAHPDEHSHRARPVGMEGNEQNGEDGWLEQQLQGTEEETDTFSKVDLLDSFSSWSFGSIVEKLGGRKDLLESELKFVERLHENKSLFHKEHQITVQPYQQGNAKTKDNTPALHSPCSVIFGVCTGDTNDSICGLADTFYNLLGLDDEISVPSKAAE